MADVTEVLNTDAERRMREFVSFFYSCHCLNLLLAFTMGGRQKPALSSLFLSSLLKCTAQILEKSD